MAATIQAQCATGATPTLGNAETGVKYSRDDVITGGTTAIPIPTATGTNFSYVKWLGLVVTATSTTSISNRRIAWASAPATGIKGWFLGNGTYTQQNGTQGYVAGNYPTNNTVANGAQPGVAPTATLNGGTAVSATTFTVASGGASFTAGMNFVVGVGTANAEVLVVSSSTATTIVSTVGAANTHANADIVAQAPVAISTSNQVWDNSSVATSSAALNGQYVMTILAVDNSYAGGGNASTSLPNINMIYDEQ